MEVLKKNILLIAIILQTVVMGSVIGAGWGKIGVLESENDVLETRIVELVYYDGKIIDFLKETLDIIKIINRQADQNTDNIKILDRQVRRIRSNGNN
jgi:hypothetical protein